MAHTFRGSGKTTSAANPVTFTATQSGAPTLVVLFLVTALPSRSGGAPTVQGDPSVTFHLADSKIDANAISHLEIWYTTDIPAGSPFTLSIPNSAGLWVAAACAVYEAAFAYGSVYNNNDYNTGNSDDVTLILDADGEDGALGVAVSGGDFAYWTYIHDGVWLHSVSSGILSAGMHYKQSMSGDTWDAGWNLNTVTDWHILAASFREEFTGIEGTADITLGAITSQAEGLNSTLADVDVTLEEIATDAFGVVGAWTDTDSIQMDPITAQSEGMQPIDFRDKDYVELEFETVDVLELDFYT